MLEDLEKQLKCGYCGIIMTLIIVKHSYLPFGFNELRTDCASFGCFPRTLKSYLNPMASR